MRNQEEEAKNGVVCDAVESGAPAEIAKERPLHYVNSEVEDIYRRLDSMVPAEMVPALEEMIYHLIQSDVVPSTERALSKSLTELRKKYKMSPRKAQLLHTYRRLVATGKVRQNSDIEQVLTTKASKSMSGVLVVTVLTSPYPSVNGGKKQRFTCEWNCYFCPNQPGQPRSYLRDEPAVLRANQNKFDAVLQFTERCSTLAANGHPVDKVEVLVLGGTWSSYPLDYREAFCRDLYYAANTLWDFEKVRGNQSMVRKRLSLAEEQSINENAYTKIIGLTLETRPDAISPPEIRRLRDYGCTRVQLGLQHTDPTILKKINRGHGVLEAKNALRLLKDNCFKMDLHLMPNLPGATPDIDKEMFRAVLYDPSLQVDQWKIYPCEVVPWTIIKKWFDEGSYLPYDEDKLRQVLIYAKTRVHPWIRLNRVIRDIPSNYIFGGLDSPNMREDVLATMHRMGLRCNCIRCREVGDITGLNQTEIQAKHKAKNENLFKDRTTASHRIRRIFRGQGIEKAKEAALRSRANREGVIARRTSQELAARAILTRRTYKASHGTEYFLSFETPDQRTIFAFLRLRICETPGSVFPSLQGCALIRELHVYGQLVVAERYCTKSWFFPFFRNKLATASAQQHRGFGRRLMADAERIAAHAGYPKIAVISGVGTRGYYRRLGYILYPDGNFLIKRLPFPYLYYASYLMYLLCFFAVFFSVFHFLQRKESSS